MTQKTFPIPLPHTRTILLACLGESPAVLTETAWALLNETSPVVPDEVVTITTPKGRTATVSRLLTPNPSYGGLKVWDALRHEAGERFAGAETRLRFEDSPLHIRILADAHGGVLEDIRTSEHNNAAADFILRVVAELTEKEDTRVIASLSGGRKSMSSLLLSAMSMLGRPRDRLTHILVDPPFDTSWLQPTFFFPTKHIPSYTFQRSDSIPELKKPDEAKLDLAEVPFARLRELLPANLNAAKISLGEVSRHLTKAVGQASSGPLLVSSIAPEALLERTPLLYHYAGEYPGIGGTLPFHGKRVLMVLHCLSNLVSFVDGLFTLGLERGAALVLLKDYPYPQKNEISHWLTEKGVTVGKVEGVDELVARMRDDNDPRPFVIIEDGGFFAPRFLLEPAFANRTLGAVEQTTKGKRRIKEALEILAKNGQQPAFPILSLPDSTIKQKFEPDHIARAVIKSIDSMIPDYLEGMPVALFGCGTIGSRIAEELASLGAKVRVYDPELVDDPRATMLSYDVVATPEEAVRHAKLIIGSAGECTIKQEVIGLLARSPHRVCYLASASSERVEIAVEYLEKIKLESVPFTHDYMVIGQGARLRLGTRYLLPANHEIILLADGLPVNFLGLAGMKDRAADLIMSLLFLGAVQVANGFYSKTRGLLPAAMDEIAKQFHVGKTFVEYFKGGGK